MMLLRTLANRIACGVVRGAGPGDKDWAKATAREMEFIESDWSALRWALGSSRILWRWTATPLTSSASVPAAAVEFAREVRKRTVLGLAACAFVTFAFWRSGRHAHHAMERAGAYLTAMAALYMLAQLLARRGRLSTRCGHAPTVQEFRAELQRQRDFHRGFWLWSRMVALLPGYVMFCFGAAMVGAFADRFIAVSILAVFLVLIFLGATGNQKVAQRYQRRIDELDRLEKTV